MAQKSLKEICAEIEIWEDWLNQYQNYIPRFIENVLNHNNWEEWDKDAFNEYFLKTNNCISSCQAGYFSKEDQSNIKAIWPELNELLRIIALEQDHYINKKIYNEIKTKIRSCTKRDMRAATNRLIAGLQPKLLCTIIASDDFYALFNYLRGYSDFPVPTGDWFDDNHNLYQYFLDNLQPNNPMDIITYPWQVLEYFKQQNNNQKEVAQIEDSLLRTKNIILYGPPGTGKTYQLNIYKSNYFTDHGISKTSEELLKERLDGYPFWKLLGAVVGTSKSPLSVSEIIEHPIIKAKINPDNKTKPNNLAWADLQSYADDESTQLESKYRRSVKLFHKDDQSKWTIAEDKIKELPDIIDQELLNLASNPNLQPEINSASKNRSEFITFHQKYSYEDFIEGIQPIIEEDNIKEQAEQQTGELQFILKKGIFYNCCLEALELAGYKSFEECYDDSAENRITKFSAIKNVSSKQFALFIDEINRANISAVFGELITLLEDDKRIGAENEMWLELPYSNKKFAVPANLYVIGSMNTADRSIALLDIALRRRFEFISLYPIYNETEWWSSLLEKINQAIYNWKKNPDFFIGHAFFYNKQETDKTTILNNKIVPLLTEYCQNNAEAVRKILTEAGIQLKQTGIKENFQIIAE